ncbi:MAG: hypothetical protein U1F83_17315 [Verrucomicrobiota bacterium]
MATLFPRAVVQLAQGAAQRFNLALVGELLAFGHFDQFQNFFHLIHRAFERIHNLHDLVNGLTDGWPTVRRFGARDPFSQLLDPLQQGAWLGWRTARGNGIRIGDRFTWWLAWFNGLGRCDLSGWWR